MWLLSRVSIALTKHVRPNPMKVKSAASSKAKSADPGFQRCSVHMLRRRRPIAGLLVLEDGRKVRVFKSNGEVVTR